VIWQQTKLFVEDEFRDVCNPARTEGVATGGEVDLEKEELMTLERDVSKEEDGFVLQLPITTISSP